MAHRVVFQQKFVEAKKREAISMYFKRMLHKLNPEQHATTEQTLNHEWIFGKAQDLRKQNGAVHSGRRHATLSLCGLMT